MTYEQTRYLEYIANHPGACATDVLEGVGCPETCYNGGRHAIRQLRLQGLVKEGKPVTKRLYRNGMVGLYPKEVESTPP